MVASAIQRFSVGGATTSECLLNYICSFGAHINSEELNAFLIDNVGAIQFFANSQCNVCNNFTYTKDTYTIIKSHKRQLIQ